MAAFIDGNMDAVVLHIGVPLAAAGITSVGAEALAPVIAGGASEALLLSEVTPEMLKYLIVKNPKLYAYLIVAISSVEGASTPGSVTSEKQIWFQLFQMLVGIEGDTDKYRKPDDYQEPGSEVNIEPDPDIEPDLDVEQKIERDGYKF